MDSDRYQGKMRQLHKARKKGEQLLKKEMSSEGRIILERYIKTCSNEIKVMRMEHILSMRLRSDGSNFYNLKEREVRASTYFFDFGNGILSAPMSYEEFIQRVRNAQGNNRMENLL